MPSPPCPAFSWCRTDHTVPLRADQVVIVHEQITGHFVRDGHIVDVTTRALEFLRGGGGIGQPVVFLWRRNDLIDLELEPAIVEPLVAILGSLDPARILAFASAIAKAADVAGYPRWSDDGEAM